MTDLDAFRQETRAWLEENCPQGLREPPKPGEQIWAGRKMDFFCEDAKLWYERMSAKGWTCPEYPAEYGGGGLTPEEGKILQQEMKALGCRSALYDNGITLLGPALLEFGNEEQKAEHLPKIVRGEVSWCQGYSEPGAGSDLASLQCKAEDKGDHFLVNGTKIWTTFGTDADWIFTLVRTKFDGPKQDGISFLLIDMSTPGVSVSGIELISGESEFAQTFFDDVKVPKENLVYGLNKGWTVAKGLLKHERKMMSEMDDSAVGPKIGLHQVAHECIGTDSNGKLNDPSLRASLAAYDMNMRAVALTSFRSHVERVEGQMDPNVPLIMKYLGTSAMQVKDELMVEMMGLRGMGWKDDQYSDDELFAARAMLFNKALTIAGGTNEVQLNIIAKRALGLPEH